MLNELCSGMSYYAVSYCVMSYSVGCEFNVNESAMSIKQGVPKQKHTHKTGTCIHQLKIIL